MGRERLKRYSLVGPEGDVAVESGLAGAEWFKSEIPRKRMKELMRRDDGPAIRDTVIWLGLLVVFGGAGVALWGSWAAVPFFIAYGVLYGSASDPRWHECGHGTAFKTRWMNTAVYQLACFMRMKDGTVWRWSHTRHHTDTLILGRDPEIQAMRPARLAKIMLNFFALIDVPVAFRDMFLHASGRLTPTEQTFVPEMEAHKVYRTARIWLMLFGATVATAVVTSSWIPIVLIGTPRIYGSFMMETYGLTQHTGMGENVLDHRLNTRSVKLGVISRFIYWNMNYHVEHHMFPMVPYHRLPELHKEIEHDLAPIYPTLWSAWKEIVPAVTKQLKDQTFYVRRELPVGAAPYNPAASDGRAL